VLVAVVVELMTQVEQFMELVVRVVEGTVSVEIPMETLEVPGLVVVVEDQDLLHLLDILAVLAVLASSSSLIPPHK
jgi:hypothetical protein